MPVPDPAAAATPTVVVPPVVPAPAAAPGAVVPAATPPAGAVVVPAKAGEAAAAADATPPVAAPAAAPVEYALVVPEGSLLDDADVALFAAAGKANTWTQEQAQTALTEHAEALAAQSTRFLGETRAHAEVGGEHLAVAQQRARAVLDKFLPADSPEGKVLRSGLDKTGYGNWTPLVLLLARIGKAMGEDTPLGTDAVRAPGAARDPAAVLYG